MPSIIQLSPHIANLIAAGEVVERPASAVKELLENAVDAGASQVTIEIRDGGMTFLRVTDNGCGMEPEDARTAFLRHATSKLRRAEDLAAIETMGFRGEALAAIASVSRIDLMTKTRDALTGCRLHLEAGAVTEESEAGCPDGTTIIVRDLFYNTPARMKFMKSDSVEGSRITGVVQLQALAHPGTAFRMLRDGKEILSTPGSGSLRDAVYCVYGREFAGMAEVCSSWDVCRLTGFVCKPTDARPSRSMQTFFVNDRPVKSKLLVSALEEAYRNQLMVGKYPVCVLHIELPASAVDVNVHPAKTEVKFLNEKAVFDCVHYGVLAALNKTPDRPEMQFKAPSGRTETTFPQKGENRSAPLPQQAASPARPGSFFRTMSAEQYRQFADTVRNAPRPDAAAAARTAAKIPETPPAVHVSSPGSAMLREPALRPGTAAPVPAGSTLPEASPIRLEKPEEPVNSPEICEQETIAGMPECENWRYVGELYRAYILVEQGENAYLIDKHAAHERILFEKLKANQEAISSQELLRPIPVKIDPASCADLLTEKEMLEELGFSVEEFGDDTLLLRRIPMDLDPASAADTLTALSADLAAGRREHSTTVRDDLLHTVACKAAIKAGWVSDELELLAIVKEVMSREELKYCPHGRPICISLSKNQIEKQFRRT